MTRLARDNGGAGLGWLGENGYDPAMGARPMARLVETALKKPLAEAILFGPLSRGGGKAFASLVDDKIALRYEALAPAA